MDKKKYLIFLIIIIVYVSSVLLYQLPVKTMFYPTIVSLLLIGIYFIAEYLRSKRRIDELERCAKAIDTVSEHLPVPADEIEREYQKLIKSLRDCIANNELEASEKYNQMIEYYTMWVHQVKTPIASMRLMLEGMDSTEARKLGAELNRIEQYVTMVLTYLRLDSDSNDFVFCSVSVDELLRGSVKKFAKDFIGKKLSLVYEGTDKVIVTDEKWFCFVVEQVLSNALKYTSKGSIEIFVDDEFLVIKDTGIGIAPQDLPRIFERGYTGYNGRIEDRSSGIGLYLCKRICDNLGVEIDVKSVVDQGTEVYIGLSQKAVNFKD